MKYLYMFAIVLSLACQGTSPDEDDNEEVQLQNFEFAPYEGPPIRQNDRALEDASPVKKKKN